MSLAEFIDVLVHASGRPGVVSVEVFFNVDASANLTDVSGNKITLKLQPSVAK